MSNFNYDYLKELNDLDISNTNETNNSNTVDNLNKINDNIDNKNNTSENKEKTESKKDDTVKELACLRVDIIYDFFNNTLNTSGKIYHEDGSNRNIQNNPNILKMIVNAQDYLDNYVLNKEKYNNMNYKIIGKLRSPFIFLIKNKKNADELSLEVKIKNGFFYCLWNYIEICSVDYFDFINKIKNKINIYYKKKLNQNVLIKPPEIIYFDIEIREDK